MLLPGSEGAGEGAVGGARFRLRDGACWVIGAGWLTGRAVGVGCEETVAESCSGGEGDVDIVSEMS